MPPKKEKEQKEHSQTLKKEETPKKEDETSGPTPRIRVERSARETLKGELAQRERPKHDENHEERRSSMAGEEMRTDRAQQDYKEMAKTWKNGYLNGLEAFLQWQAQNERLFKDALKQQLSGSRQLLTMWKDWMQHQTEEQQRIHEKTQGQIGVGNGATNPFLGLTRQSTEAVVATVEPLLKTSEAAMDSTFGYYESAVASPSRKYVREINKQALDAVIPS